MIILIEGLMENTFKLHEKDIVWKFYMVEFRNLVLRLPIKALLDDSSARRFQLHISFAALLSTQMRQIRFEL